MKFYPADWRADPALRMCSLAARGLWMEMLSIMHEADPRGSLLINGKTIGTKQLAGLCGASFRETNALLMELETAGVFSRDKDGIIFSRRMKRDDQKAERDKANGKAGGNPRLNPGVNPPDKAQRPEARDQKPERKIPLASSLADDWPDDFGDAFWQACPRKTEKLAAMRKLAMLRKSGIVTFADLMAGVKRYADAMRHTEPKYVKHPTTWLNAGCWADEIQPGGVNGNGHLNSKRGSANVPPKALAEAIRRWHRGECGPGYNYHWAPAPAELRQLSMDQLRPAKDTIAHLEAVLSAFSIERAMDPSPIAPEVKSESGGAVRIGMRRI